MCKHILSWFSFVIKCLRTFLHTDYRCLRIADLPLGVWGHLSSQRPRFIRPGQEGGQSAGLRPSPFPVTASYPQQRSSLVLRGPWFSSPTALPSFHRTMGFPCVYLTSLLLGKWSRVAWAEAYEGWESHPRWEEAGDMAGESECVGRARLQVALRAFHDHSWCSCLDLPSKEDSLSSVKGLTLPFWDRNETKLTLKQQWAV